MISKTWYQVKKASPKQLYIVLIQWWHSAAIKNYRNVERPWGWQSLDMDHLCRRWHNDWVDSYQFVYGIKWIELYVYTHTWVVVMGIAMDCINMNFGLERHSIINIINDWRVHIIFLCLLQPLTNLFLSPNLKLKEHCPNVTHNISSGIIVKD